MIIHSIAPWFLARYQPNLERTARDSLARAGFECWYPTYLDVRPLPLRKISPSKRRLAHLFVQEIRRPRFVGYILVRPLPWCRQDLNRLFDLPGCGALVHVAGATARVPDYDVELLRLAEANGKFDVHAGVGRHGRYKVTAAGLDRRWEDQGRKLLAAHEAKRLRLTLDALGRVARLVEHANATALVPTAAGSDHRTIQLKPSGIDPRGA